MEHLDALTSLNRQEAHGLLQLSQHLALGPSSVEDLETRASISLTLSLLYLYFAFIDRGNARGSGWRSRRLRSDIPVYSGTSGNESAKFS
jgi:hypothetical protein